MRHKLSTKEYSEVLQTLGFRIYEILDRIEELSEFERQWGSLFNTLETRFGPSVKIRVNQKAAWRTYRWDRYHVLAADILSLIKNEISHERSATLQAPFHLKVYPLEYYTNRTLGNFMSFEPDNEDCNASLRERMANKIAEEVRAKVIESMKRLFPKITDEFLINTSDIEELKNTLGIYKKSIHPVRQYFSHKNEVHIVTKYEKQVADKDLSVLRLAGDQLLQYYRDLGIIWERSHFGGPPKWRPEEIHDQIDLILFGRIDNAFARFRATDKDSEFYWQARENFFESDDLRSIIVSGIPEKA